MKQISERVQLLNDKPENNNAKYVLYWMQMFKRTTYNHALNFAVEQANERKLPLVVYEGLKFYYPWASDRFHTYILEAVEEKRRAFEKLGIKYVFYLQKNDKSNTVSTGAIRILTRAFCSVSANTTDLGWSAPFSAKCVI